MIGVDEVGRGCLAGPLLVVAARQLGPLPADLKDSKKLTRQQRLKILNKLSISCQFGEGWVQAGEIDYHGLSQALKIGVARALGALKALPLEEIIIDGKINYAPNIYSASRTLIKADESVPVVAAASVYAKIKRDSFMIRLAKKHPGFGFDKHLGYPTKNHRQSLKKFGDIDGIHRRSFKLTAKNGL